MLVVIPTTILLTLFASWLMGYTINRVSLFALIFSIGILVDDAIVVVENIVRHWQVRGERDLSTTAVEAVAEVGNPTIVATLTIIVALLPMMFVSGLMGPYMSPIPANASMAMLFSFFVAVTITPWLLYRIAGRHFASERRRGGERARHDVGAMGRFYIRVARPLLTGRRRSKVFLIVVGAATRRRLRAVRHQGRHGEAAALRQQVGAAGRRRPAAGATLEDTERFLMAAAERLKDLPELTSIQAYAGTAAPFNFNGLVRHYYLREQPRAGRPADQPAAQGRAHARQPRHRARRPQAAGRPAAAAGHRRQGRRGAAGAAGAVDAARRGLRPRRGDAARRGDEGAQGLREGRLRRRCRRHASASPGERLRFSIDQENLEFHGVDEQAVYDTIAAIIGGVKVGYLAARPRRQADRDRRRAAAQRRVAGRAHPVDAAARRRHARGRAPMSSSATSSRSSASPPPTRSSAATAASPRWSRPRWPAASRRRSTACSRSRTRSPSSTGARPGRRRSTITASRSTSRSPTLLWDGEWEVTYVTFRDMGAAFGVAILGIYLLVVAQFGSFRLPLVILTPVPLTLIGIVLGHWLLGAPFTATSMIGFIALAGIIVRNSILLVDFIRRRRARGRGAARRAARGGRDPLQADLPHRRRGDDRRGLHPDRPDLPGPGHLAGLRPRLLDRADLLVIPAIYVWLRDDGKPMGTG